MSAAGGAAPRRSSEEAFSWIASLFTIDRSKFHPLLGAIVAVIVAVPVIVLGARGYTDLGFSLVFAFLFTALVDLTVPGTRASRVRWSVAFVLGGTLLTIPAFLLGGGGWFVATLAVFLSTLLATFAAAYGKRGALAGSLLNAWFVVNLVLAFPLHASLAHTWTLAWQQAVAWLAGGVLWLVVSVVIWLVQRARQPSSPATPPQDTAGAAPVRLSPPLIRFALIAATAVALSTAITLGLDLSHADWMPIATLIALKPSVDASAYIGGQRVAGALLGGILAVLLLSAVHDKTVLEVVIVLFVALGVAIHGVNYALYCTCIATGLLIGLGLPDPGNLSANVERILWSLVGVLIALAVMWLADLIRDRESHRSATATA
jgi:hypothetical protein